MNCVALDYFLITSRTTMVGGRLSICSESNTDSDLSEEIALFNAYFSIKYYLCSFIDGFFCYFHNLQRETSPLTVYKRGIVQTSIHSFHEF